MGHKKMKLFLYRRESERERERETDRMTIWKIIHLSFSKKYKNKSISYVSIFNLYLFVHQKIKLEMI